MKKRQILPYVGDAEKGAPPPLPPPPSAVCSHECVLRLVCCVLGEDNSIIIIDNASVHWGSSDDQVKHELIAMVAAKGGRAGVFYKEN